MKYAVSDAPLAEQKIDAFIVFFQKSKNLLPEDQSALGETIDALIGKSSFKGEAGQCTLFPHNGRQLIAVGLGAIEHFHNGLLEQAASTAVRNGRAAGLQSFALASSVTLPEVSPAGYQLLVGRGAAWGTYMFFTFKSDVEKTADCSLTFCGTVKDLHAIETAEAHAASLLHTADLANLPGNEAPPVRIAQWAETMAQKTGLCSRMMDTAELTRRRCGGILSVGRGSAQESAMIILKYPGAYRNAPPLVLVGKTITFDSGGISLKSGKGMQWMRYDKCGGMAVLAVMQMIARMKVKIPVVGILAAAENMPGSRASRPGDIIKTFSGKTVEVLNTDAEGRLVLADALGLAVEMKPRAIVDIATLTGACIVALGSAAAAILGNNQSLIDTLITHGAAAGERIWQLPLYPDYTDDIKSDFADLANLSKSGDAGTATAAAFLQAFVPGEIPWAHLDIAGTAWHETSKPHQAPGATLFGARLLAQWIAAHD